MEIKCPKCESTNNFKKTSHGGFTIYKRLVCHDCGFEGGRVDVYEGEEERVERELVERFAEKRRDAVSEFVESIVGK